MLTEIRLCPFCKTPMLAEQPRPTSIGQPDAFVCSICCVTIRATAKTPELEPAPNKLSWTGVVPHLIHQANGIVLFPFMVITPSVRGH